MHRPQPSTLEILDHRALIASRPVKILLFSVQLIPLVNFMVARMASGGVQAVVALYAAPVPVLRA